MKLRSRGSRLIIVVIVLLLMITAIVSTINNKQEVEAKKQNELEKNAAAGDRFFS